jgi:hypothetical protein
LNEGRPRAESHDFERRAKARPRLARNAINPVPPDSGAQDLVPASRSIIDIRR